MNTGEEWRPIEGGNGIYYVSDLGRISSQRDDKHKILRQVANPKGYLYYSQCFNGVSTKKSVSRAVAKAFPEICGEWFDGCEVDHINTVKSDNRAVNLRVTNHLSNCQNPLTLALRRNNRTDEEWEEYQKELKKYYKKKDREENKEYYKNYLKEYFKKPEVKEKQKEYASKYYQRPEIKERESKRHKQYYEEHKEKLKAYARKYYEENKKR